MKTMFELKIESEENAVLPSVEEVLAFIKSRTEQKIIAARGTKYRLDAIICRHCGKCFTSIGPTDEYEHNYNKCPGMDHF